MRQRAKPIDVLLEEVGFEEHLGGDCSPPITRYVLQTTGADFDVEFITPLRGGEVKRGKPDVTLAVAGVTAQRLRYVEVLQQNPWTVELAEDRGYPVGPSALRLRIPNPASFIAQKALALDKRTSIAKRVKDVLYIHDTIEGFHPEGAYAASVALAGISFALLIGMEIVRKRVEIQETGRS